MRRNKAVGPLISVLMPVRNGIKYIGEAIDSIIDQTLEDWELVIIDNATTDGTDAYLRRRAAQDPRIVYRNHRDLGVAGNLNAGLALCRGEWIARMDAEDRAMPKRLERQLAFMLQNRDAAVVSCLAYYINAAGERMAPTALDLPSPKVHESQTRRDDLTAVLHRGAFMRREVLNGAGGYSAQIETAEDIGSWNRLAETGPVLVQTEYLMEYRIDIDSQVARFFDLAPHNHGRVVPGRRLYRAGEYKVNNRMFSAALRLAGAVALRPAYRSARLSAQLLRRSNDGPLEAGEAHGA